MLNLLFDFDGRARGLDDLKVLQAETQAVAFGQFLGLPACVVSGCEIRPQGGGQFDIGHGLVYIDGGIYRFDGVAAVTLPLELYLGPVVGTDPRPYRSGVTKSCMEEAKVASRAVGGAGTTLLVMPEGVLRFEKAREAVLREVGDLRWKTKVVAADYDADGKGKYGTKAHGWQRSNGNTGAADLRGLFPVAADNRLTAYALGATGGAAGVALEPAQVPRHTHGMDNAGAHTHSQTADNNNGTGNGRALAKTDDNNGGTDRNRQVNSAGIHNHTIQPAFGNGAGGTDEHENRPPFIALEAQEWVGLF